MDYKISFNKKYMEELTNNKSFEPIIWQAAEFDVYTRDWRWHAIFSLVLVLLVGYAIYSKQWILLAIVLVVGGLLLFSNRIRPRQMTYKIDNSGLNVNDKLYPFEQLKNYWFHTKEGRVYLNFVSTSKFMPTITIKINPDQQENIKLALSNILPMSGNSGEDWIDKINHWLKV